MARPVDKRIGDGTRGRILAMLRIDARTVEELRQALDLTDNAVRPHLVGLERDGMIRQAGTRRPEGAGKPAVLYELAPEAEPILSRAYAPVLSALLEAISDQLPKAVARKVMRDAGRRLAAAAGGRASGDLATRARAAADVLTGLGGVVSVEDRRSVSTIRGAACPLASAVLRSSVVCHAVETLVGEVAGARATEQCDRAGHPKCCFELRAAG